MTDPRKSIAASCLCLIVFYGCVMAPQVKERKDFPSPEVALKHLATQIPNDIVLQALADIQIATRERRYPLKLAIVIKKPASLRLEAIPLFGPPVFFLSIYDQTLKVFLTENRAFYIGRATLDNVARYVPLKMDPEEMIAILMGTGPPLRGQNTSLQGWPEGEHYRVDIRGASKRQSLWLRMTDGFLEHLEVYQERESNYRVRFEEPLRIEGSLFPQRTTIVFEDKDGSSLDIRFSDIQFLKHSDTVIFDLKMPPGITPVCLD